MLRRFDTQAGQTAAELTGVLLLVATVTFALATTGPAAKIPSRISALVCRIAGGECSAPAAVETRRPHTVALTSSPVQEGDDLCRYMRSLCEFPTPSDLGVDLGDEELYDITFGRGVYVSIYENATGAILLLYELCGEDVECLVDELEARGIGPQEGTGAAQWNDALAPDQWEDLEEAIRDVREEGGCLNAHFRSGINWSTRGSDDDTCQQGVTVSEEEQGAYEVELGADGARVTIAEAPTALLSQLYGFCGGGGARCVAETLLDPPPELDAYPEVAEVLEELESSAITRSLRDRVLAESEYADLDAALSYVTEHGGCLVVDVAAVDGAVDWRYGTPGERGCT